MEHEPKRNGEDAETQHDDSPLVPIEVAREATDDWVEDESDPDGTQESLVGEPDTEASGDDAELDEVDELDDAELDEVDEPDDAELDEVDEVTRSEVSDAPASSSLTVFAFSALFAASLFLLATGAVPLGPMGEGLPQIRVAVAVVLTLLFFGSIRACCGRALEARIRTARLEGAQLLDSLAAGSDPGLGEEHPLREAFDTAREALDATTAEREEDIKKQARRALVRARSECERLVEKHCERTQESKARSEMALAAERKERELERTEWENTQQIREAAQRDAEDRIAALSDESARLEGELARRDEDIARLQNEASEHAAALTEACRQATDSQAEVRRVEDELTARDRVVDARDEEILKRDGELAEARAQASEDRERLATLRDEVISRDAELARACSELQERDGAVERLTDERRDQRDEEDVELRDRRRRFFDKLASHLRGPLQTASHLAETLTQDAGEHAPETATELKAKAARLGRLADQVVDLCRLEGGNAKRVYSDVRLDRLVKEVVGDLRPTAEERGIDMSFDVDNELPAVSLDGSLCGKVLRELLSNAVRFCERGARVWVKATLTEDSQFGEGEPCVEFEIGDDGPGISPDSQERVFELFEKGRGSIAASEASCGLGLTLARGFVDLLGGEIRLHSEADQGCRFAVVIPTRVTSVRPNY